MKLKNKNITAMCRYVNYIHEHIFPPPLTSPCSTATR